MSNMNRRRFLAALGIGGISAVGAVGVFKPEVLIGQPRGEGESISTDQTVPSETIEYRSTDDTVRYPKTTDPDGPEEYETERFEDWAKRKCASVGVEPAIAAVRERIDGDAEAIGTNMTREYIGTVILVTATTSLNREGEITQQPNVPFETLVEVTPRTVETTVRLDGQEHTRSVPVFVKEWTVRAA